MRISRALFAFCLAVCAWLPAQVTYDASFYSLPDGTSVASADFNRDGRPDIAVGGSSGVDVLMNIGTGHFGVAPHFQTPTPGFILVADVNNDEWPDVLSSNGTNKISALINVNGVLHAGPQSTTSASGAILAASGDFNRDGKVDVVVFETPATGPTNSRLQILKGTGLGSFTAGQTLSLSGRSGKVEVEDMNGDGNLDIVNVVPTKTLIWPGNGDGTFRTPISLPRPTADPLASSVVADFNNDGRPDIAVSASHHCPDDPIHLCGTNTVFVYRNNGGGSFTRVSSLGIGKIDGGVLYAADVNGDQNIDIAIAQGDINVGMFDVALGKGNGTFGTPFALPEPDNSQVVFRDLDLDSRHDFAQPIFTAPALVVNLARSGSTNCPPPSSANLSAKICLPVNNVVTSPVLVRASGNSPVGIKRLEVWIDGKKQTQRFNDQLAKRFTLSPGSHRIAIQAVDKDRGIVTVGKQITVQ